MLPMDKVPKLLKTLQELDAVTKRNGFLENEF